MDTLRILKTRVLLSALLGITLLVGSCSTASADVMLALKKISEEREKSAGYAKIAKVMFKKDQKKLTQAMLHYNDAKSIGNPMIQHIQRYITSRSSKESEVRDAISSDVERLVTVNEKFRMLIESDETKPRAALSLAAVASVAGPITDACINLWKTYRDVDKKKTDEMVQTLEAYKWDDWDKL